MLANCARCERLYNRIQLAICPACVKEEDGILLRVKAYLRDTPDASLPEVVEALAVDMTDIESLIEQRKLQLAANANLWLTCRNCGEQTRDGLYCAKCRQQLLNALSSAPDTPSTQSSRDTSSTRTADGPSRNVTYHSTRQRE